ncbi:efflux RND transporter periplasmic adaptor subunit [Stappia sp. 28M-7]|uniref:efflux RND transporter periplasmic adaptor subunit n=1 Tax=Stappia sp. 28M-7 TaxID=2762596 RepID=UPI00163C7F17|nr:efflux RND transporter periplasmic adaptor subunit [Stappia sp. 28M-7]MBC2858701.1 efflux RND transporter periplasmic adaptor subunit [Stappia sp. 28M-7]
MSYRSVPAVGTAIVALALAGGVAYLSWTEGPSLFASASSTVSTATASPGAAGAGQRRGVAVETAAVGVRDVVEDIRAFGTLVANESVVISPEIAGRVARIGFQEGQRVEEGDVLVELDAQILRAELDKAKSEVSLAEANFERARKLAEQGSGTLRARDETSQGYTAAQANVALAEARLAKTSIAAPFSGIVGFRDISVGAYVSPGDRIVELASIDPLKVEFRVSETYLPNLRTGLPVTVTVDALPGETITGKITAIDPIVDVSGRAIRLRAELPNPDGRLSPGLFARIRIVIEERSEAMVVPEAAVFRDEGKLFVYRLEDGKAVKTPIEIGLRSPGDVEIRAGLASGAVVITAGQLLLRDGAAVEVVDGPRGG